MPFELQWIEGALALVDTNMEQDNADANNGMQINEGVVTKFFDVEKAEIVEFFLTTKSEGTPTTGAPLEIYALYADDNALGSRHVDGDTQIDYDDANPKNLTTTDADRLRAQLGAPIKSVIFTAVLNQVRHVSWKLDVSGRKIMALLFFNGTGAIMSKTLADHRLRYTTWRRRTVSV